MIMTKCLMFRMFTCYTKIILKVDRTNKTISTRPLLIQLIHKVMILLYIQYFLINSLYLPFLDKYYPTITYPIGLVDIQVLCKL